MALRRIAKPRTILCIILLLPIVYFVMTGPALWVGRRCGGNHNTALLCFMKPLIELDSSLYPGDSLFDTSPEPLYRYPMLKYFELWGKESLDLYFELRVQAEMEKNVGRGG